jgi:hypothetical protein
MVATIELRQHRAVLKMTQQSFPPLPNILVPQKIRSILLRTTSQEIVAQVWNLC